MASLQEYLKRYTEGGAGDQEDKKKKKKRKKGKEEAVPVRKLVPGIIIHDEDAPWQKNIEEPVEEEEEVEEAPEVVADADTRMKLRLDMLREMQAKQGSNWTEVGTADTSARRDLEARNGSPDISPPRKRRNDSPDLSPPRTARHDSPDVSPPSRARHDSPDLSPPRRARQNAPDLSPPRKARHDSPDLSPSRKARRGSPDLSPPRKGRPASPDLSPPRKARHDSPDLSPPRKSRRDVAPDLSPPRKARQASPDSSPPRRRRQDSPDLSPPRRARHAPSPHQQDLSPPRKRHHDSPDLSPPRRKARHDSPEGPPPRNASNPSGGEKPARMTDGTLAGLRTGKDLQREIEAKRAQDAKKFSALDAAVTGRGAGTVYRDKTGRRVTAEELKAQAEAEAKKRKEEPPPEWGKGMAQKRAAEDKARELDDMRNKPFARTRDDKDLDNMLKSRSRWGDPMAHLVKNKGPSEADLVGQLDMDDLKAQGFIVPQDIPPHSWLKRGLAPPYNRFGIRPGRHWDGVDRSTGFEKELVKASNAKQARANEAYLWSVADM